MKLAFLDLGKLSISKANMRYAKKAPDVADILPTVRARGILVPLIVRANGAPDHFEIVAGARRFTAATIVGQEKGEAEPLPCAILEDGDDAAALEASLIENVARRDIVPHDQRHQHPARADGRQDVAYVGRLLGVAHIGLADRQLAKVDKVEFHCIHLSSWKVPVRRDFAIWADRLGLAAKRAARVGTPTRQSLERPPVILRPDPPGHSHPARKGVREARRTRCESRAGTLARRR